MTNSAVDYVIVIPARYVSVRLPGKVLLEIAGKSLLQRVWECAVASGAGTVVIATDHERIRSASESFGAIAIMTSVAHTCGSERIAECAERMQWPSEQVIVNLQGDEPLMPPECLDQVAGLALADPAADAATLYWPVESLAEAVDPNVVKVAVSSDRSALLFSRSTIPFPRDFNSIEEAFTAGVRWKRHLGLYAYRKAALDRFARSRPTPLEQAEKLEQLRFLESGGRIAIARACRPIPAGIDTPGDLERVRNLFE